MAVDYEKKLTDIAATVDPRYGEISPTAITIGTTALYEIDARYGLTSETPLLYHNASHSVDVSRRVVRLLNIIYPFIRPRYQTDIYDLAIVAGTTHDYEQSVGNGENENASALYARQKSEESNNPHFKTKAFLQRLTDGILATTTERKENGEIVQPNLQSGRHDPFKFVMAFGDINGIAMEGDKRMILDASRLCYEAYGNPTTDQIYDFLISQATFLRERLNDNRIKSDIAYYFPDNVDGVYREMRSAFHDNILSAYRVALVLDKRPELKVPIGLALQNIVTAADKLYIGGIIGKIIHKNLILSPDSEQPGAGS